MKAIKAPVKTDLIYVSACFKGKDVIGMVNFEAAHSFYLDKIIE